MVLRPHGGRDELTWPTCCCAEATDLGNPEPDDQGRRHQVRGAVLGPIGVVLRQKAVEPQGERATSPGSAPSWRAHRPARALPKGDQPWRRRVSPLEWGLTSASIVTARIGVDTIWDADLPRRQHRSVEGREPTASPGSREHGFYTVPMPQRSNGIQPDPGREAGPALRAALPGTPAAHRPRTREPACTRTNMHWWDTQLSEYTACPNGTTCRGAGSRPWSTAARSPRIPVLAARHQEQSTTPAATPASR